MPAAAAKIATSNEAILYADCRDRLSGRPRPASPKWASTSARQRPRRGSAEGREGGNVGAYDLGNPGILPDNKRALVQ